MSRGTAVILANTRFEIDNRVRKEAESLTAAGFDVVRVGFVRHADDAELEHTSIGDIVRIRKAYGPAASGSVDSAGNATPKSAGSLVRRLQAAAVSAGGPLDDFRHYAGRRDENRLIFERVAPVKPELVIACDLDTLAAGVRLKEECGSYLVYDAHELYVEQYAEWSALRRGLYRRLESKLIRSADEVITVSPLIARELGSSYGVAVPRVVLNGPSEVTDEPSPVHDPVRILFQGAFSANRGLIPLVSEMARLRGRAVLTLQGFGAMEGELRALVESQGLADVVRFAEPCEPADVVRCGREHDVGVICYPLATKHLMLTTPNKLLDYIGAGLAIATVEAPGIMDVVDVDACGATFDASVTDSMTGALEALVSDPESLAAMKRRSAQAAHEITWDVEWGRLQSVIDVGLARRARDC